VMKTLTILLALTFSVMTSSTSFAEWKKIGKSIDGNTYYVDFKSIRKHGGYVYYWTLQDYLKPSPYGHLSVKLYQQVNCKVFRWKGLGIVHHKQPMGRDTGDSSGPKDGEWTNPPPNSSGEYILKSVCAYAK
jgi:hypothetical protein